MLRILLATVLLIPVPANAQLLPYSQGSRVRFATDSTSDWLYASVLDGTRTNVFVVTDNTRNNLLLPFNQQLRLQVPADGGKGTMLLGLGAGLAVGATLGATALSNVFGTQGPGQNRAQTAVILGAIGGLIGTLVGSQLAGQEWRDLPIQSGYLPPAPLTVSDPEPASLRQRVHRWNRFEATEEDFEAFLTAHRDSLHRLEGIWINNLGGDPVAIVRDGRFPGFEYVVVALPRESRRTRASDGRVLQVLRGTEIDGQFEIVEPGAGSNPDAAYYELLNERLILHDRQARFRAPVELVKLFPA